MVVMASSWSTVVLVGVRTIVAVAAPGSRRWIRRVRPGFVAGSTPAGPGTRVRDGSLASAASSVREVIPGAWRRRCGGGSRRCAG